MSVKLVETHQLTKIYSGARPVTALKSVELEIERGAIVAITGPSGSGKSTLLNLLGTLDTPTSGEIRINDISLVSLDGDALADFRRQSVGFVFQMFYLLPTLTALENVMVPLLPYQRALDFNLADRARELLSAVGLETRLDHLPGQLSGGECQRVAIARALINHPLLLLADEPTGNLDSNTGREIIQLLRNFNQKYGVTIILVTHDQKIAGTADKIIQMRDGTIID